MKKLTTIIVLIAGILIVSICNFNTVREAFELNTRNAAVDSKVINKENKYIKSELKIPKLLMNNKEIERILNKKFESDIMNFYNTSVKEAESYFDDFPDAENKFVISSDYEVKKSNNKVLSMLIKYYKYSGGAHGYYEYIPYNIDLRKGNFIALKDIFKDNVDYKMLINKEIENQIKEMRKNEKYIDKIYEFHGIKENQKFYLQDGKIVIFFDLYDIAPYVAGIPEFPINKEIISNLLNNQYKEIIFFKE